MLHEAAVSCEKHAGSLVNGEPGAVKRAVLFIFRKFPAARFCGEGIR